ncbi:hypothetical protein FA947_01615 [Mycoplasmoides pneumoniae]|nr:hypothetical protein FA919_01610 [Mycoplasmoides pneumoniae]QHR04545.1 hypothetical protein FA920_01615 [Mycoplasmoides pneumoniae]QHR05247.1 hypothetical protein FA921_01615 [Mycoplasmoides pneumoniae]QHR05953.1 hypothetical protein FA922_01610 [Mycoplasmoides pneumoniae]QHR06656.1 hypothetical protein FA923_01615 [Mycoplasmoides pneumoniae]
MFLRNILRFSSLLVLFGFESFLLNVQKFFELIFGNFSNLCKFTWCKTLTMIVFKKYLFYLDSQIIQWSVAAHLFKHFYVFPINNKGGLHH